MAIVEREYFSLLQVVLLMPVYSDTTQLNSTSSYRHVHSVNNVVTQLTQFVGHDVIYDVF